MTLYVNLYISLFKADDRVQTLNYLGQSVSYRVRKSSEYADGYGRYSGFYSTSLLFGTGCVDGPGSLSGSAFNQLKLVTLNNVRTFLY